MEFVPRRRRNVKTEYVTNLQLYKVPPVETISLQEFEELAEQRLKRKKNSSHFCTVLPCYSCLHVSVLNEIDRINQKIKHDGLHKGDDDYNRKMDAATKKLMPLSVSETRRKRYLPLVRVFFTASFSSSAILQAVYNEGLSLKHIEERRRDHISHYILRLAYCRT